MKPERQLARVRGIPDICIEDHGILILDLQFEYEGAGQGLPLILQTPEGGNTIKAILQALGVDSLRKASGVSCWVTATDSQILKIEPLHKRDGTPWEYKQS